LCSQLLRYLFRYQTKFPIRKSEEIKSIFIIGSWAIFESSKLSEEPTI
jgi:hypothetical protein